MADSQNLNLFPSNTPFTSNNFSLIEDLGVIHIDGWTEGDSVCVEIQVGTECDPKWIPYGPGCCGQQCICYPQSQLFISVPGQYRFVFSNKDDEHLTDPEWFDNLSVIGEKVSSNLDLTYLLEGCSDMACGLTREEVKEIVEACLALNPDKHVADVIPTGDGVFTVIMNDGSTIPFEIVAGEGVAIDGNVISVDKTDIVNSIVNDPDCIAALQAVIDTDTDTFMTGEDLGNGRALFTNVDGTTFEVSTINTNTQNPNAVLSTGPTDGTITVTPNDGTAPYDVVIGIPPETDGEHFSGNPVLSVTDETITFSTVNDEDETAGADVVLDLTDLFTALTSPDIVGSGATTVSVDPVTGNWVIASTDENTFATYNGGTRIISLANGGSINLNDYSEELVRQADGTIQLIDGLGNVAGDIPLDQTRGDLSAFITDDYGLSAGQWTKPVNRAMTYAETQLSAATEVSVNPASMERLWTNRAVEDNLGARGVTNTNGTVGHAHIAVGQNLARIAENNGAFAQVFMDQNTTVFDIPDGVYNGQMARIFWGGQAGVTGFAEAVVNFTNSGSVIRQSSDHSIINSTENTVIVRPGEFWDMVWVGNGWRSFCGHFSTLRGDNWHEEANGRAVMYFDAQLTTPNVIEAIPMPIAITNPDQLRVTFSDTINAAVAVGDALPINTATSNFVSFRGQHTTTDLAVGYRNSSNDSANTQIGAVTTKIHNGRIDYAALGGVA